jgi:hypothetical protein
MDWSGFEPEASGLQNRRSSGLIYQPTVRECGPLVLAFPRNRTPRTFGTGGGVPRRATKDIYPAPVLAA